jgi:hypothetical protein
MQPGSFPTPGQSTVRGACASARPASARRQSNRIKPGRIRRPPCHAGSTDMQHTRATPRRKMPSRRGHRDEKGGSRRASLDAVLGRGGGVPGSPIVGGRSSVNGVAIKCVDVGDGLPVGESPRKQPGRPIEEARGRTREAWSAAPAPSQPADGSPHGGHGEYPSRAPACTIRAGTISAAAQITRNTKCRLSCPSVPASLAMREPHAPTPRSPTGRPSSSSVHAGAMAGCPTGLSLVRRVAVPRSRR